MILLECWRCSDFLLLFERTSCYVLIHHLDRFQWHSMHSLELLCKLQIRVRDLGIGIGIASRCEYKLLTLVLTQNKNKPQSKVEY